MSGDVKGWWYCEGCAAYFSMGADWRTRAREHFARCKGVERDLIIGAFQACAPSGCRCIHCGSAQGLLPLDGAAKEHVDER